MRDVLSDLLAWWRAGETVGMGTVVGTWRSAPRQPGAAMLVGPDDSAVGSVSGGCVESAVYALAQEVINDGHPVLQRYGVSDNDAFAVGLTCGGILDVFVEKVSQQTFPELADIAADIEVGRPVAVATVVEHPDATRLGLRMIIRPAEDSPIAGSLGSARVDAAVADDVRGLLATGKTELLTYGPEGQRRGEGMRVFAASYAPRPRMLVFGAIDFAAAVARLGSFLGYRVTVCDARPVFATRTRFPDADEVIVDWPHRYLASRSRRAGSMLARSSVCSPTIRSSTYRSWRSRFASAGRLHRRHGSRKTHEERLQRLREAGLTEAEIERLSSPIGLDLGARTPEETAVSIAAEIISQRWGGHGGRLAELSGRIHHSAS